MATTPPMGSKRIRAGDLVLIDHPKAGEFLALVESGEQEEKGAYWRLALGPPPTRKTPPPRPFVSSRHVKTLYRKAGTR